MIKGGVAEADYDRPPAVTSSLSGLIDRFWRTFFRRGCTTGMEPAALKDQESSVAAIV